MYVMVASFHRISGNENFYLLVFDAVKTYHVLELIGFQRVLKLNIQSWTTVNT